MTSTAAIDDERDNMEEIWLQYAHIAALDYKLRNIASYPQTPDWIKSYIDGTMWYLVPPTGNERTAWPPPGMPTTSSA